MLLVFIMKQKKIKESGENKQNQFGGFDLSNFVYPPNDTVEIVKEYKWKPTHGGTGSESLTLTFTMYA